MEAGAFQTLEEGLAALYARLVLPLAVAVVAPLLGLFGAVLSLVRLFRQVMSSSPPTAEEVAQGVVASLVPLATGLIVSIIVMCFYFFLRRRIVKVGVAASIPLRESLEEGFQRR
jgi:biopolymer transport protein ExbB/TolQ